MWDKLVQLRAVTYRHRHMSQPFSLGVLRHHSRQSERESVTEGAPKHYVVCLDCGKHFDCDWSQMQAVN